MRGTEFIFSFNRRLNAGRYFPVAVLLGILAAQGNAAVTVSHLRCENLLDPQGIDASRPRLSWILDASSPNEKQTAYEVVVDGEWDSGRVESDQSIQIQYGGKELAPATGYTWKVRVWDAEGKASEWSKPATFSTVLKEWRAKWIGHDGDGNSLWEDTHPLPARYLRREFAVTKKVTRATAYVCGLGLFRSLSERGKGFRRM